MITETPSRLVTADELLALSSDEFHGELIRGELSEEPLSGFRHGEIVGRLMFFLWDFVQPRNLGTVTGNAGIWLERDPDTVRAQDLAFFSVDQIPLDADIPGYAEVIPDLVVEVRSHTDSRADIHDKALMWRSYGVRLVWAVLPETRTIDVYRPNQEIIALNAKDSLDGADVLPGFQCSLADIFGPPTAESGTAT